MSTGSITKSVVSAALPGSFVWDTEVRGFGLKATEAGRRIYIYQYRLGGRGAKVRRYTIGSHGTWTPDSARKEARRLAQLVATGIDPGTEKLARRKQAIDLAFPIYAERFITLYLVPKWKGGHGLATGILRRDVIPMFRGKSLPEITRTDIAALMDKLAIKPAVRRNAFAVLRRLFRWSVNRGDLSASPMHEMEAPIAPKSRDRVLSDDELAVVWRFAKKLGYPFGPFVHLLILTGQRREEIAALDWSELERQNARWSLPGMRAKNGVDHEVPLASLAIEILDELAKRKPREVNAGLWPKRGLVFTTTGLTSVTGYSVAKRRLDKMIGDYFAEIKVGQADAEEAIVIAPWRFHDLRRTLATGLQRLGVRFEVTEAVLNHISGSRSGIAAIYQRYDWKTEKRSALESWADHVASVTA